LGRALFDAASPELPAVRKRELRSLVGHYISGIIQQDELESAFASLAKVEDLKVGDAVETLRGTQNGIVTAILDDGRIEWKSSHGITLKGSLESLRKMQPLNRKRTPG